MHMDISCDLSLSQIEVTVSTTSPFLYFNECLGFGYFFQGKNRVVPFESKGCLKLVKDFLK